MENGEDLDAHMSQKLMRESLDITQQKDSHGRRHRVSFCMPTDDSTVDTLPSEAKRAVSSLNCGSTLLTVVRYLEHRGDLESAMTSQAESQSLSR